MNQANNDEIIFNILACMKTSTDPVGAGSVQRYLSSQGYTLAEATVGRILRDMDYSGLTEKKSNQGRVISEAGHAKYKEIRSAQWQGKWAENFFIDAFEPSDAAHLTELIEARRPVEIEVARLAARNADISDIAALQELVCRQEALAKEGRPVSQIDTEFHRLLAKASRNKILEAIVELLRKKQEDAAEFEEIRRHAGNIYNNEHRKIFEAIEQHDPDMAVLAMRRHLGNLLHSIKKDQAPEI